MALEPGIKGLCEVLVTEKNTAAALGSGELEVFSTPSMIALMEKTCLESVKPCLEEGQGTVGVRLEVSHLAATPLGMTVRAESELVSVEKRMLNFTVRAWAGEELIGEGSHQRCIVQNQRFMEKAMAKRK